MEAHRNITQQAIWLPKQEVETLYCQKVLHKFGPRGSELAGECNT